jgi:hypothetical protein
MKDDERMDRRISELARDLNAPPPTPRAEMWERIRAERAARRRPDVVPLKNRTRWVGWAVGLAATLALGVALGRLSMRPGNLADTPVATGAMEGAAGEATNPPAAYRVATAEHLGRVETFLTVFSADAPDGRRLSNADFETSARQLLRRTRMLRQSPVVANDVALRALLDDVEFVLLQIASFAQVGDERELDFVEQGITERSVMLRLRSALPNVPERATVGGSL